MGGADPSRMGLETVDASKKCDDLLSLLLHGEERETRKKEYECFTQGLSKTTITFLFHALSKVHLRGSLSHLDLGGGYMEIC